MSRFTYTVRDLALGSSTTEPAVLTEAPIRSLVVLDIPAAFNGSLWLRVGRDGPRIPAAKGTALIFDKLHEGGVFAEVSAGSVGGTGVILTSPEAMSPATPVTNVGVTEQATAANAAAALPALLKVVAGWDGVNVRPIGTTAAGAVVAVVSGSVAVSSALVSSITAQPAAANVATGQVVAGVAAATLVAARAARRAVTIKNLDAAITVYVGPATVTAANGMPLTAGQSITIATQALLQVIAASGTPTVAYVEEYD